MTKRTLGRIGWLPNAENYSPLPMEGVEVAAKPSTLVLKEGEDTKLRAHLAGVPEPRDPEGMMEFLNADQARLYLAEMREVRGDHEAEQRIMEKYRNLLARSVATTEEPASQCASAREWLADGPRFGYSAAELEPLKKQIDAADSPDAKAAFRTMMDRFGVRFGEQLDALTVVEAMRKLAKVKANPADEERGMAYIKARDAAVGDADAEARWREEFADVLAYDDKTMPMGISKVLFKNTMDKFLAEHGSPELRAEVDIVEKLEPLSPAERRYVVDDVEAKLIAERMLSNQSHQIVNAEKRYDTLGARVTPELTRMRAEIKELDRKLYYAKADLVGKLGPFLEFCRAVRGYDFPTYRGEPGAYLMAMGRIFPNQEDVKLEEMSELVECVELGRKYLKSWAEIAPNAELAHKYLSRMFEQQSGNWLIHFSRSWAKDGFPTVELPHKTAAALMFTDGDPGIMVDPPWRGFLVKVPDGMVASPSCGLVLSRILAWYAPEEVSMRWWLMMQFRGEEKWSEVTYGLTSLDASEKNIRETTKASAEHNGIVDQVGIDELTKMTLLASRLVAGACMMISAGENVTEKSWEPKPSKTKNRPPGVEPPEGTRFIIGKNVEIDLRDHVKDFISSGKGRKGAKLSVQVPVRGHRRNQAWGPKHTLRKEIWIKPFWRGPLTGEALLRGYKIKQSEEVKNATEENLPRTNQQEGPDDAGNENQMLDLDGDAS